ncbi:MAG: hypothetical protein ACOYVK_17405 [Bacillota bacterium]
MKKKRFQVIKGNKIEDEGLKYRFIEAHVTNTRLMGVIGIRVSWETEEGNILTQFFHLDAEEYGFDEYVSLLDGTEEQIERTTAGIMGGLGGQLTSIHEKEVKYLVREFAKKNKKRNEPLPDPLWEYDFILKDKAELSEEELKALWLKLCAPVETPFQLINYFVMRSVGMDHEGAQYLMATEMDYHPVKAISGTLLKNVIEPVSDEEHIVYMTESIIEEGDKYKMFVSEIETVETSEGLKIAKAEIKSKMNISSTEAAFTLMKKEYIAIYSVLDLGKAIIELDQAKPQAMKHAYETGLLYTEFNPHNDHVKAKTYYLSEDVHGIYYITIGGQMIVGAYTADKMDELQQYFNGSPFADILSFEERMDLDSPLLYEFVHSEYENIYDFLEEE